MKQSHAFSFRVFHFMWLFCTLIKEDDSFTLKSLEYENFVTYEQEGSTEGSLAYTYT